MLQYGTQTCIVKSGTNGNPMPSTRRIQPALYRTNACAFFVCIAPVAYRLIPPMHEQVARHINPTHIRRCGDTASARDSLSHTHTYTYSIPYSGSQQAGSIGKMLARYSVLVADGDSHKKDPTSDEPMAPDNSVPNASMCAFFPMNCVIYVFLHASVGRVCPG